MPLLVDMERNESCVLITGASSGLGEEFVRQLVGRVDKMVLVARREEILDQIAEELRAETSLTTVMVIAADLASQADREMLLQRLDGTGFEPNFLINNAGLGDYGEFVTAEWETVEAMLKVNIEALTHLSHMLAPRMVEQGGGAILNVSSLASTLPIPDFAVYAATKAYVSSFSEALRIELASSGVDVMHLCAGPVKTAFGEVARRSGAASGMPPGYKYFYLPKSQVVAEALAGLERGKARVFPGLRIAVAGLLIGAVPLAILRMILTTRPRR